ncbi:DUF2071 domain-containing protein [Pseudokineococcus marinus]|nr:DUF2071 domain-containing protein [Pseudokineococcus marinus]
MPAPRPTAAVEPVTTSAPPLRGPVLMGQRWCDLAFLHWAVPPERVRAWMPPGVRPDVVVGPDGEERTYVALVPFRLVGAGVGRGPAVPWLGTFWETNVRLYSVDATGRRGVVFASLDASRLGVVLGARAAFGLPYRWARLRGHERVRDGARELLWTGTTRWPAPRGARSRVAVRVGEPIADDAPDADLAAFLTARWGLHTAHLGRTWHVPNEHGTWSLRRAEVLELDDELLGAAGFGDLARRPPDHVAFAGGTTVRFGLPGSAQAPRR